MEKIQQFGKQDAEVLHTETLFQGFFKMVKYQVRHRLYAGGWSDTVVREIFERGHAVAVLPYDPVLREFVLIEQFRVGAMATSETPWLLEVVAGIIDPGESPEQVCMREAQEEAGLELLSLHHALSYLSSPGGTTERLHIYIARVDASNAGGIHGLEYENEDILVHRIKENDARQLLESGKIDNAASVIALQWFFLHRQNLINEWKVD
ncbi:ADP-ribose diphosphatase [Aestuariibacter salexigens]|uniref:ADP-ribose diphosphatase n=1 Tax=Aestuariibacter salexigens TaxID=226010 RepID=UPI0004175619|nr:ADP-ribose diphosphatase [Aestuariibacter salexigens]